MLINPKNFKHIKTVTNYLTLFSLLFSLLPFNVFASGYKEDTEDLIQFQSNGHVLGFNSESYYIASGSYVVKVEYVDGNKVRPVSVDRTSTTQDKPSPFNNVRYKEMWDGIDIDYSKSDSGIVKSTYYLNSNANVEDLKLKYNNDISIDNNGDLVINYETGILNESAPIAWQEIDGEKKSVDVSYKLYDKQLLGFELGEYQIGIPIIIDPDLSWNAFLGTSGDDRAWSIAIDNNDYIYISGTSSASWGTTIKRAYTGSNDAYIVKFDSNGNYQWNTFLGGSGGDGGTSVTIDNSGNIYLAGDSGASWGTTIKRAYTSGLDPFIAKLDSNGNYLWNSFFGGASTDLASLLKVDNSGNIYLTGHSASNWGETVRRAYSGAGGYDGFVVKLDSEGNYLWNTYLGGPSGGDYGNGMQLDSNGNIFVMGTTTSSWGTTIIRPFSSGYDAYVAKLDNNGNYQWNTFLGGSGTEEGYALFVDSNGYIYVTGSSTASWGSTIKHAYYGSGQDGYFAKLDNNGNYLWNTFYGGSGSDAIGKMVSDLNGNIYAIGSSNASWGSNILRAYTGGDDSFVVKFDSTGNYKWNTFIGGSGGDYVAAIAQDSTGNFFLSGYGTASWGTNIKRSYSGGNDGFVVRLNSDDITPPTTPDKPTLSTSWIGDHYIYSSFIVNAPSGSTDTGGSLLSSYSLFKCDDADLSINCVSVASGIMGSSVTVSSSNLPPNGSTNYYYWVALDGVGNVSNKSVPEYLRMITDIQVYSISPSVGPVDGGTEVTISGINLDKVQDNYTKMLLHFENNITDEIGRHTFNTVPNSYSTSIKKFGSYGAYISDVLSTTNNLSDFDFGTGNFTIDFWSYRQTGAPANSLIFGIQGSTGNNIIYVQNYTSNGYTQNIVLYFNSSTPIYTNVAHPVDSWVHNALVRDGDVIKYYLNGNMVWTGTNYASTSFTGASKLQFSYTSEAPLNSYLDEFRVSKGIARWFSNFTVPNSSYIHRAPSVSIGGSLITNLTFNSPTSISGTTSTNNEGLYDVVIANADGTDAILSNAFTYEVSGNTIILPAIPDLSVVLTEDWTTDITSNYQTGIKSVGVLKGAAPIASMDVNFESDSTWTGISADYTGNKSFFHSTSPISDLSNGESSTYTLYVPKGDGDKVWICPGASSLEEVSLYCSGGYYLSEGQTYNGATASVEAVGGTVYWKVEGLTGTGGMSVVTGLKDTLSRLQTGVGSDHTITFGTNNGLTASGNFLVLAFDPSGYDFDLSSLTLSDIVLTDNAGNDRTLASSSGVNTWGVEIDSNLDTITFFSPTSGTGYYPAASQIVIKIGTNAGGANQIINPSTTGSYQETIYILNTDMEGGTVQLPIIDSDRVDITGYVTAYMHFDIDTGVGEVPGIDPALDCNYDTCFIHQNGGVGSNYTVDLGELTSAVVNKSNTTSVAHTSGGNGIINSIYFDISTNAPSGAVVTVKSANGGLQGPGTNKIPSIGVSVGADGVTRADGEDIPANSGVYGYNLPVAASQLHGSIIPNSLCDSVVKFCGADSITPKTVFTTNNLPVDTARVRMDLAAAANYTNNPGLYTDTLTFVATATF